MRALPILFLLAFAAAPVLAQEAPVATAPQATVPVATPSPASAPTPESAAPPVIAAPPAPDTATSADQAVDPLADLIAQSGPQTTDEEEPAAQAPLPPHKPTVLPIPPLEPPLDEIPGHAVPQGSYIPMAEAYDLRIKGSIVAAQGLQGPLDGGWTVTGPDGATLYDLQIVDPVGGYGALEGAWRDVRRVGAVGSTGLIDFVDRSTGDFLTRFSPRPGQLATLDLTPRGDGGWAGKLNENGVDTPVTARRVAQATLPPGYVAAGRGPVIWPRPISAAPRAAAPERGPSCSTKGKKGKALKTAKAKCAAAAKKGGKGKASAVKGKKGAKGKAVAGKGKSSKGKATAKGSSKKKKR